MDKTILLARLKADSPGWDEWDQLMSLVESLEFEIVDDEFLGKYLVAGTRLCFGDPTGTEWPAWMPGYVAALYEMKADDYEMAGGYAGSFSGRATERGGVFCEGPGDEMLGFPVFDVPPGVYKFQSNESGALFHIDGTLNVLAPNSEEECLTVIDPLDEFTKKNIRQVLAGERWFKLYQDLPGTFMD